MTTAAMQQYETEPWAQHIKRMQPTAKTGWRQGEHVLISGPTSAGKTTLASKLLPIRSHVVMLVTKTQDDTFAREFRGWKRIHEWPKGGPPSYDTRILLWPKPGKTLAETRGIQREVMAFALDEIGRQGKRTVCVDEALYMADPKFLNLANEIGMLHYFGRSAGISMVTLTQRPAWIPRVVLSSVSHAYVARTYDKDDAKRLADLGGVDARLAAANVAALPDRHDYVYLNPQGDAAPAVVNTQR